MRKNPYVISRRTSKAQRFKRVPKKILRRKFTRPRVYKTNPREFPYEGKKVEIYASVREIIAVKGPGHSCSKECRAKKHTYRHVFKKGTRAMIYGLPDGSILIK